MAASVYNVNYNFYMTASVYVIIIWQPVFMSLDVTFMWTHSYVGLSSCVEFIMLDIQSTNDEYKDNVKKK